MNENQIAILVAKDSDKTVLSNEKYYPILYSALSSDDHIVLNTFPTLFVDESLLLEHHSLKPLLLSLISTKVFIFSTEPENTIQHAVGYIKDGFTDYFKLTSIKDLVNEIPNRLLRLKHIKNNVHHQKDRDFSERYASVYELMIKYRFEKHDITNEEIQRVFPEQEAISIDYFKEQLIQKLYNFIFKKESILAIEDEEALRNIYYFTFKKDYTVHLASHAEEGLSVAKQYPDIAIVLLDVFMPGKNGNEILPDLKELLPSSKIFLVTAYKIIDIAVESLQVGAYDYINKPIDHHTLRKNIEKALEQYHRDKLQLIKTYLEFNSHDFEIRVTSFKHLIASRDAENLPVLYKDLYFLFPEITEKPIFEHTPIPKPFIANGVEFLIAQYLQENPVRH